MKNLKETVKNVKDDKKYLIFYGGLVLASVVAGKVINNMVKK